ncbi:MAG: hypothetical protein LAP39_02145 [Acidobacteriia bacterium]|nr:hypothetical protein [Terriglobia bacterium]
MSKRAGWALTIAALAIFLLLNRAAYKGFFQDDDLDTLGWARGVSASEFLEYLATPRLSPANFRPVGAFYYHALENAFGLDFPKYVAVLHALHFLNIWLVWLLIRKLGIGPLGAAAGAFFFGYHAALIDAWWKPMYVFDILCATFSLLAVLLYACDRWILSLISFWLAYKSKELAVMLPAMLACYELWLGQRRWKRLIPFFAVSLLFGVQAAVLPVHRGTRYEMQLGLGAQAGTIRFYSSQLFLLPYAGLLLLALPLFIRDRRLWFGLAAMCLLLIPLLLLPGRLYAVYWYVPLAGAALMLASLADGHYRWATLLLLVLWIPWDFVYFRELRRINLQRELRNRAYVGAIENFARLNPSPRLFVYDALPEEFHDWGVVGALRTVYRNTTITAQHIDYPGSVELIQKGDAAWLHWNRRDGRLDIVQHAPGPALPYLRMDITTPAGQLIDGWYALEDDFRWMKPDARAVVLRPASARNFEVVACVLPEQIGRGHAISLRVLLNAQPLRQHDFTVPGCQSVEWPAPPGPAGNVKVEFHIAPPYIPPQPDSRILGITMKSFGFTS